MKSRYLLGQQRQPSYVEVVIQHVELIQILPLHLDSSFEQF